MQAQNTFQPVKLSSVTVACQRCLVPMAVLKPDSCSMIDPGSKLTYDGDAIPNMPSQLESYTCLFMASFGRCGQCNSRYWFLDVYLHTADGDPIYALLANDLDKPDQHYTALHPTGSWLIYGYATEHGRAFHHSIGPLLPSGDDYDFWRLAASRATELIPDLIAMQTAVTREAITAGIEQLSQYPMGIERHASGSSRIIDEAPAPYSAQ